MKNCTPTPLSPLLSPPKRETSASIIKISLNTKESEDTANNVNNFFCSVGSSIQSNVKQTFKAFYH